MWFGFMIVVATDFVWTYFMVMSALRFHILPSCVTIALIVAVWVTLTLPIAAVFMLDRQFVVSDYLKFVLHALWVGSAITLALIFPIAYLTERVLPKGHGWHWPLH